MCGIAGILARENRKVDRDELIRVSGAMMKRGPDGEGLWVSQTQDVALAHRRLAIIDLSESGKQPMTTRDGRLTISFNGEIYNYKSLRDELMGKGYRFESTSDTEVLLYLYAEYGAQMLLRLRGMFAFGIWDELAQRLFLARDALGIKPLYYSDDGSAFRFASQVKALMKGGAVDSSPDPAGYVGFFLWGHVPDPHTIYRNVHALPAGSYLYVSRERTYSPEKFFELRSELARACDEHKQESPEEASARLRRALEDSVAHHLVSDVPVALFLSAGIDSSAIATLATREGIGPRTITLGFAEFTGTDQDEVPAASEFAGRLGLRHESRWVSEGDFHRSLPAFFDAMDQPTIDGVNTYFVAKAAAEAGVKVALSGTGGDELFGGYSTFSQVPMIARLFKLPQAFSPLAKGFRVISSPLMRRVTSPKFAGLFEYGGNLPGAYLLHRGLFMPWELPNVLDPEIVAEGLSRLQPLARLEDSIYGIGPSRRRIAALEMSWYMRCQLLRDADWAGMAHSLEIRVPFVDTELLRVIASFDQTAGFPNKRDMGRACGLSVEQVHRAKSGFNIPVRAWMKKVQHSNHDERGLRGWSRTVFERQRARKKKTLISTLRPAQGGVAAMTELVARELQRCGHEVALAYHLPYSLGPELSVPFWKIPFRRPRARTSRAFGDILSYEIGSRFPALEFARCLPSSNWREIARSFDYHLAVSGSVHAALPITFQKRPCLAWVATPYLPDKVDRARSYPWHRRLVDRVIDTPICLAFERIGLRSASVLALSSYTANALMGISPGASVRRMTMPMNLAEFSPSPEQVIVGRIGFSGRLRDPRKNVKLLLEALHLCRRRGYDITADLIGGVLDAKLGAYVDENDLTGSVRILDFRKRSELKEFYRALDVFVIPSFQEGLGIVGLEAMACGCPVVSTRCGGTEDYVRDGLNGYLVGFSPTEFADAICTIVSDRAIRHRMSIGSLSIIKSEYSQETMRSVFWDAFDHTFNTIGSESQRS